MNAIRVLKHIDSDLVDIIPELREMMGQDVEITIIPQASLIEADGFRHSGEYTSAETLETLLGDALHRPPPGEEEMAELRALAETEPAVAAALRMSARGGLDVETILATRNAE